MSPDNTYSDLIRLRKRLEEKVQSLSNNLKHVQQQLDSVSMTLSLLGLRDEKQGSLDELEGELIFPPEQLKGLTHHQALERIAKANGNHLRLTDAKRVIVAAGLIATPKNAYSILANTIGRVGKFRKVGPGEFELPNSNKEERPLLADAAHR